MTENRILERTYNSGQSTKTRSSNMSEYASQTVAQLKEILKERNLSTDGKKAELVERLTESDKGQAAPQTGGELDEAADESSAPQTEDAAGSNEAEKAGDLTVIPPSEGKNEESSDAKAEEKPKPKVLTPEERKQLAVDLLTKKIQRAEKFGDEGAAEASRKDLARVEKFGVELGTALAREIGILDKNFNQGLKTHKFNKFNKNRNNNKRGFKNNKRGGFKNKFNNKRRD